MKTWHNAVKQEKCRSVRRRCTKFWL